MEIAVDGSGNVIQYGQGIGTPAGCTLAELTDAQEAALVVLLAQPSGGIAYQKGDFTALPVPLPPPPPPNANQALMNNLNALTLTPGGEADQVRQVVVSLLKTQPPVPAI